MGWSGGNFEIDSRGGKYFNPFAPLPAGCVEEYFTERLPPADEGLQWTMLQLGANTAATRGNEAIARQGERPTWLSKPAYLCFGALRAFPNQQLRRICAALHDRLLPLGHPATRVLLQQAVYHIGDLSFDPAVGAVTPAWRGDWQQVLPELGRELSSLAEMLREKPRDHDAIPTLAALAVYFGEWDDACAGVARTLAGIARLRADAIGREMETAAPESWPRLEADRALFNMRALVCYGGSRALDIEGVAAVCGLAAQTYSQLYSGASEEEAVQSERSRLRVLCRNVVAARAPEVVASLLTSVQGGGILSAAAQRVLAAHQVPDGLQWAYIFAESASSSCFEACTLPPNGHLISVNVLNGAVLFDGTPPRSLPAEIRTHPLYVRTFGEDQDFRVTRSSDGVLTTTLPAHGRIYEFYLLHGPGMAGARLSVWERDSDGNKLELLDGTAVDSWCADLPVRLRELHSHWLCRELNVIVLRPVDFRGREIGFVIWLDAEPFQCGAASDDLRGWACFRVPDHLQLRPWTELHLKSDLDRLTVCVNVESTLQNTLSRLELPDFIHPYISPEGSVKFHLPRFDFEFHLSEETAGRLVSASHRGYYLSPEQQLDDTLLNFSSYLVLKRDGIVDHLQLLVPDGRVARDSGGCWVVLDEKCNMSYHAHVFPIHERFGQPTANSIAARLQLAAMYAATSTKLPEPRLGRCGSQFAMDLVRFSWSNKPLSADVATKLSNVVELSGSEPGLRLLCFELASSAAQLSFLHVGGAKAGVELPSNLQFDPDAAAHYLQLAKSRGENARRLLTDSEELRILGGLSERPPVGRLVPRHVAKTDVPGLSIFPESAPEEEEALPLVAVASDVTHKISGLWRFDEPVVAPTFPLPVPTQSSKLEREMLDELQNSFAVFHASPRRALSLSVPDTAASLHSLRGRVTAIRSRIEAHLLEALGVIPEPPPGAFEDESVTSYRLLQRAAAVASPTPLDLLRIFLCPDVARDEFQPFLSEEAVDSLHDRICVWLELCVLEDKTERLLAHCAAGNVALLLKELQVVRDDEWDPMAHPEWLVFEVEGRLQIRPAQLAVARNLIANPEGTVVQLNMGEGKTRVILPLLALHWGRNADCVQRLHFLPALIDEAYDYLHRNLCASVLNVKLFRLPFHRATDITAENVDTMRQCLLYCQRERGLLLVSPEQRLSLELKWQELRFSGAPGSDAIRQALTRLYELPYRDLLDECDELLSHKWKLVYSVGKGGALPAGPIRWRVVQEVLRLLKQGGASGRVVNGAIGTLLSDPDVVKREARGEPESFDALLLIPGERLDAVLPKLYQALVSALIDDTSEDLELRYRLRDHSNALIINANDRGRLIRFTTDNSVSADTPGLLPELTRSLGLEESHVNELFALRGLLAYGHLAHCLKMRHCVNFGVNGNPRSDGQARKSIAVPFLASNTPSDRSEFANHEVAIVYTTLAYYDSGLSSEQVVEAFSVLFSMGVNAQRETYLRWWRQCPRGGGIDSLDSSDKIDLSNSQQRELLVRAFAHNTEAINFWLDQFLFPRELTQYPGRIEAGPWHLAANASGLVTGFSGTNDTYRLLPFPINQREFPFEESISTNGKMLQLITQSPRIDELPRAEGRHPWQAVLDFAACESHALIDAGGLIAGVSNFEAATHLSKLLSSETGTGLARFSGVQFFNTDSSTWMVLEASGRCLPKGRSPISDADAFAFFDEARCRGADLKLRQDAVAVVTVGPGMTKDKLMQACGRMRALDAGQRLRFLAPREVTSRLEGLTTLHLLTWIMANTVKATADGLFEWAKQGAHFANTRSDPSCELTKEATELRDLFGAAKVARTIASAVAEALDRHHPGGVLDPHVQATLSGIRERARRYGNDLTTASSGHNEECERELEKEAEAEEEAEFRLPTLTPASESTWDFSAVLSCASLGSVADARLGALSLPFFVQCGLAAGLREMTWTHRVFMTANFASTLSPGCTTPGVVELEEYLRPVDFVLAFPSGELLLLSEREADAVLALAWRHPDRMELPWPSPRAAANAPGPIRPPLLNLYHIREALPGTPMAVDYSLCVQLQLFNGETMFADKERARAEVVSVMATKLARDSAPLLSRVRGQMYHFAKSHLQEFCAFRAGGAVM